MHVDRLAMPVQRRVQLVVLLRPHLDLTVVSRGDKARAVRAHHKCEHLCCEKNALLLTSLSLDTTANITFTLSTVNVFVSEHVLGVGLVH